MKFKLIKNTLLFVLHVGCFFAATSTIAQKLPTRQETGLKIPADFKIDGKATEWKGQFQAYNNSTEVFYSIANDKDNLYLIVQAIKPLIAKKIIGNGLTFTVNLAGKKDVTNAVSITYPLLRKNNGIINSGLNIKGTFNTDSAVAAMNSQLSEKSKEIRIEGVPSVTDSLLSVYNDTGLKAVSLFSGNRVYTYELAIPLKMIGLSVASNKFTYQIQLNGLSVYGIKVELTADGRGVVLGDASKKQTLVVMTYPPDVIATHFPTNFWGEYTLVK